MKAIFCPRCHSPDIVSYAGGITGTYKCNKCGYMGSLVIEKDFIKSGKDDRFEEI